MDGIRDIGGLEGFGPVVAEPDEPVFHADWERRMWGVAMSTFARGLLNGGQFRHAAERMDPAHYLTSTYYEHWFTAVTTRLVEEGVVPVAELEQRAGGPVPLSRPVVGSAWSSPGRSFSVGDRVRVRDVATRGHTRCPRYVRRRVGEVVRVDPPASLPDVEAHSDERVVEPIYSVRFTASELWGGGTGNDGDVVHVDLWQSYLEAA